MSGCYGQCMLGSRRAFIHLRVAPISGVTYGNVADMATRVGTGRPSLGDRTQLTVRIPPGIHQALRDEAQSRGISMNQALLEIAADHLGVTEVALPINDQEKLSA